MGIVPGLKLAVSILRCMIGTMPMAIVAVGLLLGAPKGR